MNALKESIAHWYRISDCMTIKELEKEGYDADSCPLCLKFSIGDSCDGCPVMEATGHVDCKHTPYNDAAQSLLNWSSGGQTCGLQAYTLQWSKEDQDNVEAEIRFLESLL